MNQRIAKWCLILLLFCAARMVSAALTSLDYKISPLDLITVEVFDEKELSRDFRVSATGSITYPLLGTVSIKGLTARQVETKLKEELEKDYLVNANVTVSVKEYRKRVVTVLGEVNRPGALELPGEQDMDVLEAISRCEGFTKAASKNKLQVTREGKQIPLKLDQLLKDTAAGKPFLIQPGDVILVPQSFW
jgi:protein involved in polysaccharide export with SLBB domain